MNTTLRYSAYVALLLGSTSIALADGGRGSDVSGMFTVGGGLASFKSTDDADSNDLMLGGAAAVAVRLAKEWSFQIDLVGEQIAVSHDDVGFAVSERASGRRALDLAQTRNRQCRPLRRLWHRNRSVRRRDDGVQSGEFLGLEGQLFFNDITLYGQAATLDISEHS